ncbi:hypothetical protein ACKKBG_A19115 [Auxenochlorella protothecoides x Auxenochlorella symbiontica]
MEAVIARLEAVATRLEATDGRLRQSGTSTAHGVPATVSVPQGGSKSAPITPPTSKYQDQDSFSQVISATTAFLDVAERIGGEVLLASRTMAAGVQSVRKVLPAFQVCRAPSGPEELQQLLAPVATQLEAAGKLGLGSRSPYLNHFKVVGEAAQALSWVAYSGPNCGMRSPPDHVSDALQAAEFYANKVLKDWRPKDAAHGEWVAALKAVLKAMQDFCAAEYPRGPAWKEGGLSAACFLQGDSGAPSSTRAPAAQPPSAPPAAATTSQPGAAQPAKRAGQVPRAPPPPPPGHLTKPRGGPADEESRKASGPTGVAALFADLNRGTAVTAGLRKVTADMKTKNRPAQEGAGIAAPAKPQAGAVAAPQRAAPTPAAQPPRFELVQGQKWAVEHQVGVPDLVVADTEPKHTVYVYGCRNSTIQVKGKVNAISLDKCSRVGLLFDRVVASVELINSSSVDVQCTGGVPTLAIDACDGVQLYLPRSSLDTDVTTAKSSGVNIIVLAGDEDGGKEAEGPAEAAVPEQFVTRFRDGAWVTTPVSHSGA